MPDPTANPEPALVAPVTDHQPGQPDAADATETEAPAPASAGESSLGDTAGTGTIIALGCITGTIFIIILGVIYLLITQLFG